MFSPAVLASWFRLKYPHIASGAIASSAPILEFDDVVPLDSFYHIVSNDFKVRLWLQTLTLAFAGAFLPYPYGYMH